jgi:hypothetical protein
MNIPPAPILSRKALAELVISVAGRRVRVLDAAKLADRAGLSSEADGRP